VERDRPSTAGRRFHFDQQLTLKSRMHNRLLNGATLTMRSKILTLLAITALATAAHQAKAADITLGTAGNFAVLAGASVTNTATPTAVSGGDVGAGSSITGFGPGTVTLPYTTVLGGAVITTALNDLNTAYTTASLLAPTMILTGTDLGGLTLAPGVYFFASSAQLTGTLTLNDMGDANAQFVFQIGSTLTTASNAAVVTENGGATPGSNVFWQVGSSATLGTGTAFEGHILAYASVTLNTSATILDGSALAETGSVTLDDNVINNSFVSGGAVPEPATMTLALVGGSLLGLAALRERLRRRRD
jgi:hypothetical protein